MVFVIRLLALGRGPSWKTGAARFCAVMLLLFAVAGYVLWEGLGRIVAPAAVESTGMPVVTAIQLAVNLIAMRPALGVKAKSLYVRGADLEVWAACPVRWALSSASADHADRLAMWVDAIVAIGLGLWVSPATGLLKDTGARPLRPSELR